MFVPNPIFAHLQTTHPDDIIHWSPEEVKTYAGFLIFGFQDLGFLGVFFWKIKKQEPIAGI